MYKLIINNNNVFISIYNRKEANYIIMIYYSTKKIKRYVKIGNLKPPMKEYFYNYYEVNWSFAYCVPLLYK